MKVVALGGAGAMGRVAVQTAAGFAGLKEIVIADLNDWEANKLVAELQPTAKAAMRAVHADVTDKAGLRTLFADADVVLNTTGPFYRFGVPILEAALETKTHYLDICDDWEPTLDMLQLHERAMQTGVTAIIGMGASPGISNLLAVLAARELDEITDLFTAWPVDVPDAIEEPDANILGKNGVPSAATIHWMQQISGTIRLINQGKLTTASPLEAIKLDYPKRGGGTAYTVGHPEPITLQHSMTIKGRSATLMVVTAGTLAYLDALRQDIDAGKLTLQEAGRSLMAPSARRMVQAGLSTFKIAGPGRLPTFFAFASGRKQQQTLRVGVRMTSFPKGMANSTGIPLALGLLQFLQGHISTPGVYAPEAVIDPQTFFTQLEPYCTSPVRKANEDLVVITTEAQ